MESYFDYVAYYCRFRMTANMSKPYTGRRTSGEESNEKNP